MLALPIEVLKPLLIVERASLLLPPPPPHPAAIRAAAASRESTLTTRKRLIGVRWRKGRLSVFTGWRPPSLLRRPAAETNTNARCLHHIVSRRARSIAAASIALVALVATAAPAPAAASPAVVLSYYNARDLKRIVTLLGSAGLPAGTPVYYGNYYGTSPPRKKGGPHKPPPPPVTVPNGRQAPIFPFSPSKFW